MWINIDIVVEDRDVLYLPEEFLQRTGPKAYVCFGQKKAAADLKPLEHREDPERNSFADPLTIRISAKLKYKLQIPKPLVYQMKTDGDDIVIGPVIGLMLGNRNHIYSPLHMKKYSDRFGKIAEVGGLIYAFSPKSVDWDDMSAYGLYYNYFKKSWKYGKFPLPSAIYRRDFHTGSKMVKRLSDITGGKLFNSLRFTKLYLYQFAGRDPELSGHMPPTEMSVNYEQVKRFIDEHRKALLKPVNLSRGRGICFIACEGGKYVIDDYRRSRPQHMVLASEEALKEFFSANQNFFSRYLIQEYIPLALIGGSPFDIRVVMQKDAAADWVCSGIECRVANNESLLTNISRGGCALSIAQAIEKAFPEYDSADDVRSSIEMLCRKLCLYLDGMGQHFAELGIDIAMDKDKKLWVIEANVFPSFKGFREMDYPTYLEIRYTPIFYASHLAGFQRNYTTGVNEYE